MEDYHTIFEMDNSALWAITSAVSIYLVDTRAAEGLAYIESNPKILYPYKCAPNPLILLDGGEESLALYVDFVSRGTDAQKEAFLPILAFNLSLAGHHTKAVEVYDLLIERSPEQHSYYENRGKGLIALGQFASALEDFEYLHTHHPNNHQFQYLGRLAVSNHLSHMESFQAKSWPFDLLCRYPPGKIYNFHQPVFGSR